MPTCVGPRQHALATAVSDGQGDLLGHIMDTCYVQRPCEPGDPRRLDEEQRGQNVELCFAIDMAKVVFDENNLLHLAKAGLLPRARMSAPPLNERRHRLGHISPDATPWPKRQR